MGLVKDFEDYKILDASVQFINTNENTVDVAVPLGCVGTMEGTGTTAVVEKKCEGKVIKKITRTTQMEVTVNAHGDPQTRREIYGLKNDGLKKGVYAYNANSFPRPFIFTARVVDMEGKNKFIAFPNVSNATGLSINIDNDVTEINLEEFGFNALPDKQDNIYYEAYEDEIEDADVKEQWLNKFNYDLVKAVEAGG